MTLDIAIRYGFVPLLGLWAFYHVIREVSRSIRDYRRGEW